MENKKSFLGFFSRKYLAMQLSRKAQSFVTFSERETIPATDSPTKFKVDLALSHLNYVLPWR